MSFKIFDRFLKKKVWEDWLHTLINSTVIKDLVVPTQFSISVKQHM